MLTYMDTHVDIPVETYYDVFLNENQLYKRHDDGNYTFRIKPDHDHKNEVWLCDVPRNLVRHVNGQYKVAGVFFQPIVVHMYVPVTVKNKAEVGLRQMHSFPDPVTGRDNGARYYEANAVVMLYLPWKELCETGTFNMEATEPFDYNTWAYWHRKSLRRAPVGKEDN